MRQRGKIMAETDIEVVPEGSSFLVFEANWQDQCAEATTILLPQIGAKAPKLIEGIGAMLSVLYRLATCHWDCKGEPHTCEYLMGSRCQ
jgi:hypothetical protein